MKRYSQYIMYALFLLFGLGCDEGKIYPDETVDSGRTATVSLSFTGLKAAHEVYDLAYPKYPFYCTCRLSRKMYPFLVNHQLQTVAAHCGYDLTQHHNAMADAYACAHIALTMMREKEVDTLEALMASCYSR